MRFSGKGYLEAIAARALRRRERRGRRLDQLFLGGAVAGKERRAEAERGAGAAGEHEAFDRGPNALRPLDQRVAARPRDQDTQAALRESTGHVDQTAPRPDARAVAQDD